MANNVLSSLFLVLLLTALGAAERRAVVGNVVYAGDKTSVCFSDRFLTTVETEGGIPTEKRFRIVHLASRAELDAVPFVIMNGQEAFTLTGDERVNLKRWLDGGGFLLASAGCSSQPWQASFRSEMRELFGAEALREVPRDHALFRTLFTITDFSLSHGGSARFEGVERDGRLTVLFSPEGLNDTAHTQGCCCCGGNEVRQAEEIVADALAYALVE
jgi:hypothetical protein